MGVKLNVSNLQGQVNEIHPRVALLNQFTKLGRPDIKAIPKI